MSCSYVFVCLLNVVAYVVVFDYCCCCFTVGLLCTLLFDVVEKESSRPEVGDLSNNYVIIIIMIMIIIITMYIYIYTHTYVYIYIYIHLKKKKKKQQEKKKKSKKK